MFNIGPMELLVLAVVGLIILGPDRLPGLARDAARLLKALREIATGAQTQLKDELGPEFANLDFRSLNPKTAIQRVLLGDDDEVAPPPEDKPLSRPPVQKPLAADEAAPFDEDAT